MHEKIKAEIENALKLNITPTVEEKIELFYNELDKWNEKINLCGKIDEETFWLKHVADTWLAHEHIQPGSKIADIGSGAGIPGIPLKILIPGISMTLYEKSIKKATFLKHIIRTLELKECIVEQKKIDKKTAFYEGDYDIITIRALKVSNELEDGIRRMMGENGKIILYNNSQSTSAKTLTYNEWRIIKEIKRELPVIKHNRVICIFEKCST